jgi:tryptophan-rich sensory protein
LRWWHGVAFFAGVQAAAFALRKAAQPRKISREQDREFYSLQRLPAFAPPAAAFPIAWTINSACAIAGLLHVLNLPPQAAGRTAFLRLQGCAWALFATFDAAYFGLRSPWNAAAVTIAYSAITGESIRIGASRLRDPVACLALAPAAAWLILANPVAITQALWNRDPFWQIGPLLTPNRRWLKEQNILAPAFRSGDRRLGA